MSGFILPMVVASAAVLLRGMAKRGWGAGLAAGFTLAGAFILLYAKFVIGDQFLSWAVRLPSLFLLLSGGIWMLILGVRRKAPPSSVMLILAIALFSFLLPGLDETEKYVHQEKEFQEVASFIFDSIDAGNISIGDEFPASPGEIPETVNPVLSDETLLMLNKLHRRAGIYRIIAADHDVVYFTRGAVFQSISGIAITRNSKDPVADAALHARYFDGAITYDPLGDGAYEFFDGL
ncbi:hypothetical protein [Edaphobacillus lindanitolerans]|uniref:Uncharacterized protein n=1 Tax=Edaphobacillus lindanitolerans TaxID=550447 RepID=A0A1U7PI07_9BACI|nr:hypothetical protein [Edaphobacillus lindanitolerans]SIT70871.1 hypothetical protein SAMN05428946_0659 [Edaphobacillus lindanitolerans]